MSMHRIPLTEVEEYGLRAHGLDIGTPSQLSDAFRQGLKYGQLDSNSEIAELKRQLEETRKESFRLRNALSEYSSAKNPSGIADVTTSYADSALGLEGLYEIREANLLDEMLKGGAA